ncbi:ankyrin repeat-containing domain protein [Nemania diffusa]|nr:ankyrin repeat-containing domain protein [Nemania diffusa]
MVSEVREPLPIHIAAFFGITNLVRQLLEQGSDFHVRLSGTRHLFPLFLVQGPRLSTPLHLAILSGEIETAMVLLSSAKLTGGELVQAIYLRHDSIIPNLLSRGANIFDTSVCGRTVLDAAAEVGNQEMILLYFDEGGIYRSIALYRATQTAVKSHDYSIVRLLATKRPIGEIDRYEASCLVLSLKDQAWDLIYLLLNDPFLPGEAMSFYEEVSNGYTGLDQFSESFGEGATPLSASLQSGNRSIVKAMIQRGYPLQFRDEVVLVRAMNGFFKIPDNILSEVWPPQKMSLPCQQLLLLYAIILDNLEKVRDGIDAIGSLDYNLKFDYPEIRSKSYFMESTANPLALAVHKENMDIFALLISRGATIDWPTSSGQRALDFAASCSDLDMVEDLLNYGSRVDPPVQLERGATALQYAAINGDLEMARILVDRGADVNAPPAKKRGRTALEGAAEEGRLDMVQYLLECGAKLEEEMRIHFVRSARFAYNNGHSGLADYIMQRAAWTDSDWVLYNHPLIVRDYDMAFHIMQHGPWTESDQAIYNCRFKDKPVYVIFLYDKESNHWQIKEMWHCAPEDSNTFISSGSFDDSCSDSSSNFSSSVGSASVNEGSDNDMLLERQRETV